MPQPSPGDIVGQALAALHLARTRPAPGLDPTMAEMHALGCVLAQARGDGGGKRFTYQEATIPKIVEGLDLHLGPGWGRQRCYRALLVAETWPDAFDIPRGLPWTALRDYLGKADAIGQNTGEQANYGQLPDQDVLDRFADAMLYLRREEAEWRVMDQAEALPWRMGVIRRVSDSGKLSGVVLAAVLGWFGDDQKPGRQEKVERQRALEGRVQQAVDSTQPTWGVPVVGLILDTMPAAGLKVTGAYHRGRQALELTDWLPSARMLDKTMRGSRWP